MARPRRGQRGACGVSGQVRAAEFGDRGTCLGTNHVDCGDEWAEEQEHGVEDVISLFGHAARDHYRGTRVPGTARMGAALRVG